MGTVLQLGCLLLGILCLCYYAGILFYAGIRTSLSWLWALSGVYLILLFIGLNRYLLQPARFLAILLVIGFVLVLAAAILAAVVGSRIVSDMHMTAPEGLSYVIVLGARVQGEQPSRALKRRLDCALNYAKKNPGAVLILSGGQGADEKIPEALCMFRCLTNHGLPESRLVMEDRSGSTKENLEFSAALIKSRQKSTGILSSDFHIYRALLLAERLGFTDAHGIPATADPFMQPHNIMREICCVLAADLKWKFTGHL